MATLPPAMIAFQHVFGRVHAAGDGDVALEMAVENRRPVQPRQQFRRRGEVQRRPHFERFDIEVRLIEAVEEHHCRARPLLQAARTGAAGW